MTLFEELKARGLVAQMTDEKRVEELINGEPMKFYIGFDPTADSLHIGHFVSVMVMAHMQRAGHTPIALFGGGTGLIGDPSGKTDMRKMLTKETIAHNIECFRKQMGRLVDFSDGKAIMVNNADWLADLNYISFIREIGVHFSVNRMLAAECYKQRLERGLSFFELNYMLMQSYDFLCLARNYDCKMQLGGDDQWSNMIGGVELNRRADQRDVCAMTFGLLLTSEGKKMGKTEKGAVWLDAEKTSPYDFFQYWRNVDDADVIKCMKMLTFIPLEEIAEYEKLEGSALNPVKEKLAYELTVLIHGEEEAEKARNAARSVFSASADDAPIKQISAADFTDGQMQVAELLVKMGIAASKGEAKRLIQQGGVSVDGEKITDAFANVDIAAFDKGYAIVRKGKKVTFKAVIK
ncbi:MAG: tyrosine--tRNA ligase [Clostridia bacterium]|nr:tyrosine--tRNA ligase [Clostridia bacterium]